MSESLRGMKAAWIVVPLLAVSVFVVAGMGPGGKSGGGYEYAILSFDENTPSGGRVWTLDCSDRREVLTGGAKEMRFELKISTPIEEIRDRHILDALGSMGWKLTATSRTSEADKPRCSLYFTRIR